MIRDVLAFSLERYLSDTLHDQVRLKPFKDASRLPAFLGHIYNLFEAQIVGRRCLILAARDKIATPSDIAKHVSLVRAKVDAIVAFAASSLAAYNRSRLISQGIGFIVPGNQLYMPELAIDLREHFRTNKPRHFEGLSPAAQVVLFDHIQHPDPHVPRPSLIAERLRYSAMSIGRAFDDLVALQLAKTERRGKERHLAFNAEGQRLLESARPLLRSPVRTVKYIRPLSATISLKQAGESALAELTDLSRPQTMTYAVFANDWKSIARTFGFIEVDSRETDIAVETWSYDPASLSNGPTVDPLSLYAQFWNHRDERISMAAEKLLEHIKW